MELTREFLLQKAHQWGLTNEQEEVLVLKFGEEQSNQDISERLGISINACVQCLGEIYKKAGIIGRSRGKAHRLRSELLREAEQSRYGLPSQELIAATHPQSVGFPDRKTAPVAQIEGEGEANRQYLEDLLEQIQQKAQDLSTNPDGESVEEALQLLSENLPKSTAALASESRWKRVEVVQQILQKVGQLFTTIDPSLDDFDGLNFLNPGNHLGNPIHRSIAAFIQRVAQQLGLEGDSTEITEKVLEVVLKKGHQRFQDISIRPSRENPELKTYPAWVRKTCLTILLDYLDNWPDGEQELLVDPRNGIDRNLMAIDASILEMYLSAKKDDVLDLNYFDILVARWMKNMPWRKSLDSSPADYDHPIILSIDPVDLEWASLSSLRRRYHGLDLMKKYDLLRGYFLDRLKDVKDKYKAHFWLSYDEIESFSADKYKIIGIPRSFLEHEGIDQCESMAEDVWRYCELAAYNHLSQENLKELEALLEKAFRYPILDFWFNEIDHFLNHALDKVSRSPVVITQKK